MAGILGAIGGAVTGITNAIGTTNPEQGFIQQEQAMENQQLQDQLQLQGQQNQFNNALQEGSEVAHESASLQTFAQDISNARNTLTSSDLQQIK